MIRCWINLGEARLHQFKIDEGLYAYYEALKIGDHNAASRLLRAKGWSDSWQQFEEIIAILHSYALGCNPDIQNSSLVLFYISISIFILISLFLPTIIFFSHVYLKELLD